MYGHRVELCCRSRFPRSLPLQVCPHVCSLNPCVIFDQDALGVVHRSKMGSVIVNEIGISVCVRDSALGTYYYIRRLLALVSTNREYSALQGLLPAFYSRVLREGRSVARRLTRVCQHTHPLYLMLLGAHAECRCPVSSLPKFCNATIMHKGLGRPKGASRCAGNLVRTLTTPSWRPGTGCPLVLRVGEDSMRTRVGCAVFDGGTAPAACIQQPP